MFSNLIITIKVCFVIWFATFVFTKLINRVDAAWLKQKPQAMMMGFYAVGMLMPNVWIMYITLLVALPVLAKTRAEAAALFIVALGSVPDLTTYLRIGGTSIMGIDKWFWLSLGFLFVMLQRPGRGLRFGGRYDIPFLLIFVLELVQARGLNFTSTLRSVLSTVMGMGLPYFVLTRSIHKIQDFRRVMIALLYIGFVMAVIGVYESRSHLFVYQQISNHLGMGALSYRSFKFRGGILRPITSFGESTSFALFLVIIFMAAIACRESFRSTTKFVYALAIIAVGIFVCSSRNAYIALIIGIFAFDLFRKRFVALTGKATLLAMAYAMLLLLAEVSPYFRSMTGKDADTASTSDYRTQLLTRGMQEFHKHPYAGIDPGTLIQNMQDLVQGEGIVDFVNGYLFYALTTGVFGFVALILAFLLPCYAMLRTRRAMSIQGPLLQRSTAFVFAISFTYLIATAFTGFGNRGSTPFYEVLALGAVLYPWRRIAPELLASTDRGDIKRPRWLMAAPEKGDAPVAIPGRRRPRRRRSGPGQLAAR